MEDVVLGRFGSPPESAEVLVVGSPLKHPDPSRWRRRAVLLGLALILVVAGIGTWQWQEAVSPTFSTDEIAAAYRSLPSSADSVAWDVATVSVEDSARVDQTESNAKAAPCDQVYSQRLTPVNASRVSIELAPVGRPEQAHRWSGSAVTFRYEDPDRARAQFRLINDALNRCHDLGTGDPPIGIKSLTSGQDTWSRSVTRFKADLSWSRYDLEVNLVRFGNTVTWVVQGDGQGFAEADAVTEVLMRRLEASHQASQVRWYRR